MHAPIYMSLLSTLPVAFSSPSKPPITNTTSLPIHFGVLLYPGFQVLDAFGAIDVLNTLSNAFELYENMHFDVIGETKAPISTLPRSGSNSTFGQQFVVTTTYNEVLNSQIPLDVLIIPGGIGTRAATPAAAPFIKAVYPRVQYILSVCSGATIVAAAGILDGRKATTSKANFDRLTQREPNVHWQRPARWVEDGNIWSASGGGSSSDLALAWIGHMYGDPVAQYLGDLIELNRAHNSTDDPFSEIWT
ncbi:DJ-1/PfpI family protein [Phaeosphaeria sp. MPI-PUGE-AT-0046c]|nr:DJ-1/PfpI family protein [Phaeosphaeria sp. MPI-PUGE-AT-0046c]